VTPGRPAAWAPPSWTSWSAKKAKADIGFVNSRDPNMRSCDVKKVRNLAFMDLRPTPLLPDGYRVPASRWENQSARLRKLMEEKPYVFGPGIFDPHGAELVMYFGFDAVYFSGYSFAIGHLGTTDMDIYSSVEIADGARRIVSGLRKFQLTMALGDPDHEQPGIQLEIPP